MKIRTKEKCPLCSRPFEKWEWTFVCPKCRTRPRHYYIELCWEGTQHKIYSDTFGAPFVFFNLAKKEFERIEKKIAEGTFDPEDYKKKKGIYFNFEKQIGDWLNIYKLRLEHKRISPRTFDIIERQIRLYYIPFFRKQDIRNIKNEDIEEFTDFLPKTLSSSTVHSLIKWLRTFFIYEKQSQHIQYIPHFPTVPIEEKICPLLSQNTIQKIYEAIPDHHKGPFMMLWKQGMRPCCVRALYYEDVNWNKKTITIRRSFSGNIYQEKTKTKKIRTIPLDPNAYKLLYAYKKRTAKPEGFIFTTQTGKPYGRTLLNKIWASAIKKVKIPHVRLYSLRHTFASNAINRGVEKYLVMKFLGTSIENYIHVDINGLKKVLPHQNKKTFLFSILN